MTRHAIADLRREYARAALDETDVAHDPLVEFGRWLDQALQAEVPEPHAMTLATAAPDGTPSARIVLLRHFDERGFVFFTDYRSQKGTELEQNPRAALCFHWHELERQVRLTGIAGKVSRAETEAYFHSRPVGSRRGAWASHQSQVLANRAVLEAKLAEVTARHPDDAIPVPPHWGGFRIQPHTYEFWQGRRSRLHDRIRYRRDGERWVVERVAP